MVPDFGAASQPSAGQARSLHAIDMPIIQLQPGRQFLSPAQPDRPTLDIYQQSRALQQRQSCDILKPAIGNHQQPLLLSRKPLTSHRQPMPSLVQRREQRRAPARPQLVQPSGQTLRRFQPLYLPFGRLPAGRQQGHPRALAVGVIKQLGQQTFGIGERTMAPGRRRRIDNHQPQFMGRATAQVKP
ncbi:hypothetical protein [Pseudomonas sp. 52 E 6]|nr:hypothetical protein [Pseudomonas sp. 52 E 6]